MTAGALFLPVKRSLTLPCNHRAMMVILLSGLETPDLSVKDLKEFFHVYPDSPLPENLARMTRQSMLICKIWDRDFIPDSGDTRRDYQPVFDTAG